MKTLLLVCLMITFLSTPQKNSSLKSELILGGWHYSGENGEEGQLIFTEKHFALTLYKGNQFLYTKGGKWKIAIDHKSILLEWEFNTEETGFVGKSDTYPLEVNKDYLTINDKQWVRTDDTTPGKLKGAWLIIGRKRNGEMNTMTPGARKTMKILSGKYFQWIACNSETGEFFGTGGGNYSTENGIYTEKINFFSKDSSRVGATLAFDFDIKEGNWHHSGKSSKGDPIYEIWTERVKLGM